MGFMNKEFFKSLRFRIGLAFFAIFIPLMVWMIYYSSYAGKVVRDQVAQSNKNLVTLYMGQIDRTLGEADEYLYNMVAEETDLIILDQPDAYYSVRYQEARIRLFNNISTTINNSKTMDMFFVYSGNNDDFLIGPNLALSFKERDQARILLTSMLKNNAQMEQECTLKWCVQQIDQEHYLSHVAKIGNVYVGAWVNAKRMMIPLNLIDLGETGISVLSTEHHEPMDHHEFIAQNGIDLALEDEIYKLTGNNQTYLEVAERSKKGSFYLTVLIPENGIMEKLPVFQRVVLVVPLGFVIMLLLLLLFLRKLILRPIYKLLMAMRRFKEGKWDTRIVPYSSSGEFEVINAAFNDMVAQIEQLKIDVYEEQLSSQRAELKHLQLQINPHFYLNSLNIVYHLAQAQKYELIQEMSLSLVEYFRYMFRSNLTFVPLKDEIRHTCNYLNIQKMRFPKHLDYEVTLKDDLEEIQVPPLIVQTFVENTIKHAVTMDDSIHIHIVIDSESSAEGDLLKISIEDSGKGFPDDVLQRLQSDVDLMNDKGENIGIWNVKRRIALLYPNRAHVVFMNGPKSGAKVEIRLPMEAMNNEKMTQ
ncbi:sensor histidine kinase [Paenibacillus periandrae]|uniref:sensor histidine kinase n=1 Tax=Paenibacillus periandrae TaxID=1761741 RepID=UPI001F09B274|nr:histidine kinase [Paenibacillus periandrae]